MARGFVCYQWRDRSAMIVITGPTGYVGSYLVELLGQNEDLLLVSRDPQTLRSKFPALRTCNYEALADADVRGATFLHLAVLNNDQMGSIEDFRSVNVDFLLKVADIAKRGGAERFINICSTHALEPAPLDVYGRTKAEGALALASMWPEGAVNLYVPLIYGGDLRGKLALFNLVPRIVRPALISLMHLIKPMISVANLTSTIRGIIQCSGISNDDGLGMTVYAADPVDTSRLYSVSKRTIDLVLSTTMLICSSWLMLLIAIAVKANSRGPAIFAQDRVGLDGKVFTCLKFRTMFTGTRNVATHEMSGAAVTSVGRHLRRLKLDELPQLINVLRNEMSFVGPRPCLPTQSGLIKQRAQRGVIKVKPGITGLAQINGIDMSDPVRLASWDERYCTFRSLAGDVAIMIRTALGRGGGDWVAQEAKVRR